MSSTILAQLLEWEKNLPEWEREASEYERKAAGLRRMIEGVRLMNGEADLILAGGKSFSCHSTAFEVGSPSPGAPRGREAVRRVMGEQPDREWKVVEIKKEMLRLGWAPNPKSVEASIARLRADGEVVPVRYGYYKLAPQAQEVLVPTDVHSKGGEA